MATIEELNRRFAIPGVAQITSGNGGLPRVSIATPVASGEIYLHGAQITSWSPAGHEDVIFLSRQSQFEAGKAIRGGIPVCFPWFRNKVDDPKAPSHGVVRTKAWALESVEVHGNGVLVSLSTVSDEGTRAWWPHDFHLLHRATIGSQLTQELVVTNTDPGPVRFEEALHTYYHVDAAESVHILGLDGVAYLEKAPLIYWAIAISYKIFGFYDWAARIPIALSAMALAWVTAAFGIWAFGRRAGFYAGLVMVFWSLHGPARAG